MPFGIDKVTKYHIDAQIYSNEPIWVMNTAKYAALSPARRTVIDTRCTTEAAIKISTPWAEFEQAGPDHIKTEPGHEVYALTAAQLAA